MLRSFVVQLLLVALGVTFAATVIGVVTLWPSDRRIERPPELRIPETERAEVVAVAAVRCTGQQARDCVRVTAELSTGPDKGTRSSFTFASREADFDVGDRIRVYKNVLPETATLGNVPVEPYAFSDFERRSPLLWLGLLFAALVIATGRWQGLRALIGLGASLLVVVFFVVPAILDGRSPTGVAIAGCLTVMFATIPLTHGLGPKTIAACLGTTASLLLTLGLADAFTGLAHLSGISTEEAAFLRATTGEVSLQGLLLAGMVIGALGVLDDLTVTQASTVLALRRANERLGFGALFRGALSVGHDHIAATVNTLVLAYVGASLPILLIFSLADTPLGDALNSEAVAEQIVATLVGSIGLITAVPITTALAALMATRLPARDLADAHAHAH